MKRIKTQIICISLAVSALHSCSIENKARQIKPKVNNYKPWAVISSIIVGLTHASDIGLIGYFDSDDCPEGWKKYDNLIGRVPVGSGNYIGTADDGRTEALIYNVGSAAGEVYHTLTISEMVSHNHGVPSHSSGGGVGDINNNYAGSSQINNGYGDQTSNTGGSNSHNNMPPYLVLTPCIKTKENIGTSQQNLSLIQTNLDFLQSELTINQNEIEYLKLNYATKTNLSLVQSNLAAIQTNINQLDSSNNIFESNLTFLQSGVKTNEDEIQSLKLEIANLKQLLNYTTPAYLQSTPTSSNNNTLLYTIIGILFSILVIVMAIGLVCWYKYIKKQPGLNPSTDQKYNQINTTDNPNIQLQEPESDQEKGIDGLDDEDIAITSNTKTSNNINQK